MHENIIKLAELTQASTGEDKLALAFAEEHAGNLRYVAAWGRWLAWDGTRWISDDTLHTFDRVRSLCREVSAKASAQMVAAVERLGQIRPAACRNRRSMGRQTHGCSIRRAALSICIPANAPALPRRLFDQDHRRRTGRVMLNTNLDQLPRPRHRWRRRAQRVYWPHSRLCADRRDAASMHCSSLYGTGANGKSILTNDSGRHSRRLSHERTDRNLHCVSQERHPTDLAGLRGARLVTVTETEEGRRWAESKDQGTDRRRQDIGPVHAARLLRIHCRSSSC